MGNYTLLSISRVLSFIDNLHIDNHHLCFSIERKAHNDYFSVVIIKC